MQINLDYLQHNTYTDIITFDYAEEEKTLEGDIFISVDRINENASKYKTSFYSELYRVMSHGILHLMGFKDKTSEELQEMRDQEAFCLNLLPDKLRKK